MSTPTYALADWAAAMASPWNGRNSNMRALEALIRGSVADRDLSAPPGSCADGAAYLVKATATGAWVGKNGQMAISLGVNAANGWLFVPVATEGQILWIDDENIRIEYNGSAWVTYSAGGTVTESFIVACGDETTAITTGTAKVTFRMPYAFTVTDVRASLKTAPTGANLVVDINEGGVSILSTKLSVDATEKTSTTAATPPVISDANLADDAEITIDFDQVGSSVAGVGVKVIIIGHR